MALIEFILLVCQNCLHPSKMRRVNEYQSRGWHFFVRSRWEQCETTTIISVLI